MNDMLSFALGACLLLSTGLVSHILAADVAGTWHSEFDSQRGGITGLQEFDPALYERLPKGN